MQRGLKASAYLIVASLLGAAADTAVASETAFATTYKAAGMRKALPINGYEPSAPGTYPVFVYVTGTKLSPWSADDELIVQEMAQRGFVAVAVDYTTRGNYPATCAGLTTAVREIFAVTDPASAINVVDARPKADVGKGLVVMGFSQGANIASLSKNHDPAVQAVFLVGNGYNSMGLSCYNDGATVITADRSRSIMGANDAAYVAFGGYGGNLNANRQVMETTSGVSCGPAAASCIAPDGSGWHLVQSFETATGKDDHCFHYASAFCGTVPFDANFLGGNFFWALGPSLDWLAGFATP